MLAIVTLSLNCLFQITEHGLVSIAKQCKQLRKLNVSRCYGVTDRGVTALVQGCPLLTELDIGWCYKVSDQSLRLIPLHCSHFESIRIKGCCVSDRTLRALYAAKISVNNFFWVSSAKPFIYFSFIDFISFTLYMYLWFCRDFISVCVCVLRRRVWRRERPGNETSSASGLVLCPLLEPNWVNMERGFPQRARNGKTAPSSSHCFRHH